MLRRCSAASLTMTSATPRVSSRCASSVLFGRREPDRLPGPDASPGVWGRAQKRFRVLSRKFAHEIWLFFSPGSSSFFGHETTASLPHHSSIRTRIFAIFHKGLPTQDTHDVTLGPMRVVCPPPSVAHDKTQPGRSRTAKPPDG